MNGARIGINPDVERADQICKIFVGRRFPLHGHLWILVASGWCWASLSSHVICPTAPLKSGDLYLLLVSRIGKSEVALDVGCDSDSERLKLIKKPHAQQPIKTREIKHPVCNWSGETWRQMRVSHNAVHALK